MYEGEEAGFKDEKPAKPQGNRKILYYRNPMGLPDVSSTPKKDSMGMDYVPVYEGDEEDGSTVKIAPGKLQRTGVQSEPVSKRVLVTSIRAPGVVQADEHRQAVVALRFDAFLNGLEHVTTGSKVRKGEPLMRVYSSALSAAAAQYITDLGIRDTGGLSTNRGARQRLENLGVPEEIIKEIERSKQGSLQSYGRRRGTASSSNTMSSKACRRRPAMSCFASPICPWFGCWPMWPSGISA